MNQLARRIQRVCLTLLLGNTLAASFIWGINTLFLLDAGLSNLEAFAANAFFTAGMVHDQPRRLDASLLPAVADERAVLAMGDRLDAARAGVHVLLRRSRGVAGRRPALRRVPG
jgi:hypothetical protein